MSQSTPTVPAAANHTGLLITLTIIAALGGLLFGYDSAVISGATESIKMNFVAQMGLAEEARLSLEAEDTSLNSAASLITDPRRDFHQISRADVSAWERAAEAQ